MVVKSRRQSLVSLGLLVALLGLLILPAIVQADNKPPEGYSYTVRQGDTWSIVSRRTGVSVADLKRLNPQAIHPKGWLVGWRTFVDPRQAPDGRTAEEVRRKLNLEDRRVLVPGQAQRHLEHRR